MKSSRYLTLVFAISFIFRLYPYMNLNLPFSIDAWPLIRDTISLIRYSPIPLDSILFDGYNNYWPGSIIFSTVFSEISGVYPVNAMAMAFPFINSLGLIILYSMLRKMDIDIDISIISIAVIGTLYPLFFFGAGVTKETFAFPLYITLLYFTFTMKNYKSLISITLLITTLILTHHLTSLITLVIIAYALSQSIFNFSKDKTVFIRGYTFITLFIFGYLYYFLYAYRGMRLPELTYENLISVLSYLILFIFISYQLSIGIDKDIRQWFSRVMIVSALALALAYFTIVMGFSEEVVRLPRRYLIFSIPYISLAALASIGIRYIRVKRRRIPIIYWFSSILALMSYSIFGGNPLFTGIIYRLVNFLIVPLSISAAASIYFLRRRIKLFSTVILIIVVVPSVYAAYSAYYMFDPYLGYNWRNQRGIYQPGHWLSNYNIDSLPVAGDTTVKYLFKDYYTFGYIPGLSIINSGCRSTSILILYRMMYVNGYNSGSFTRIHVDLDHAKKIYSRVYDNNNLFIYLCCGGD